MADHPDKQPIPPDETPDNGSEKPENTQTPVENEGWHEPPTDEDASRPIVPGAWYTPPNAVQPEEPSSADAASETEASGKTASGVSGTPDTPDTPQAAKPAPGIAPDRDGGWFKPLGGDLDDLLSGAADTIIEQSALPQVTEPRIAAAIPSAEPTPDSATPSKAEEPVPSTGDTTAKEDSPTREISLEEAWVQPADLTEVVAGDAASEKATAGLSETVDPTEATPSGEMTPAQSEAASDSTSADLAQASTPESEAVVPAAQTAQESAAGPEPEPEIAAHADQSAPATQTPSEPDEPPQPSPFEEVERKVDVLRRRYKAGTLTRDELQKELRGLMILDDEGHWWMIGMESNRWYYFDGRDWVPGVPPGHDQPKGGSIVPTETGLQQVIAESVPVQSSSEPQPAEDDSPLPRRVPQRDPEATLVSTSAPFIEPVRRSDAPTITGQQEVPGPDQTVPTTRPGSDSGLTQPSRPVGEQPDMGQTMLHGEAVVVPGSDPAHRAPSGARAGDTLRSEAVLGAAGVAGAAGAASFGQATTPGARSTAQSASQEAVSTPKPRFGEWPQPDYSVALGTSRNRSTYAKWGIRIGVFAVIGGMVLALLALIGMAGYYFYVIGEYSDVVANLDERVSKFETTEIFNANGTSLAQFNSPETGARTEVSLENISPWLIHATVATENETFYTDPGFSVLAILRATYQNLQAGSTVSGASTITQQLARALVLDTQFASARTNERKIVEIIVASEIKRKYSKNEILQIYLNEIFYGNRAYGIEAAAQTYFGKTAAELNPAEAAFLAGLPQSPATYDPVINREAAMSRFEEVLRLMSEANGSGCVTIQHQDQTNWAIPQGGTLCVTAQELPDGSTAYYYQTPGMAEPAEMVLDITRVKIFTFQAPEFEAIHPHFVNYVWQQLEETYGAQAIYAAGFRVTTTLDETIQAAAEDAVTSHLATLRSQGYNVSNASVVTMRPSDGAVLAMVGSADYYDEEIDGQVNVAFTGQQPGSSIKPFVYLTALEPDAEGKYWTPGTVIWDVQTDFNGYVPTNYDLTYHGPESVRQALANSLNVPAVKALDFVGLEEFTRMAERIGLRFPLGDPVERNAGLTTALGAVEVRLFDMVNAYAMLANNGRRIEPYSIQRIEDSKGNQIFQAETAPAGLQVVKPEYAYLLTNILSDNEARAAEFGRGWPMELSGGRPAAIKTGTTNENRDVWTLGYTPQFVTGVWVGNTDNTPMGGNITGYRGAAPIWNSVMETAHQGLQIQQFVQPAGVQQFQVCADSGAQPTADCAGRVYMEIAAASAPPPVTSEGIIREVQVDEYTGKLVNEYCPDLAIARRYVLLTDSNAYNWINNTGLGNQWAATRGLQVPVMPPPTEYCSPNDPRPVVVLDYPPANATVQGVIELRGAVQMQNFSRYELRYGVSHEPGAFSQPYYVDTSQRTTSNSVLGEFDTTQLQNGQYTLRLVAIDQFGRSVTRDVAITINNIAPTQAPQPTAAPTITPIPGGDVNEPLLQPSPTLAPSPTATWTLTPTPG